MAIAKEQVPHSQLLSGTILQRPIKFARKAAAIASVKESSARMRVLQRVIFIEIGVNQLRRKRHIVKQVTDDIFIQGERNKWQKKRLCWPIQAV